MILSHLQSLWGRYWPVVFLPPLVLAVYAAFGEARIEHYIILIVITGMAAASLFTRDLLLALVPGILVVLGYEAVRFLRPFYTTPERIWACEFRSLDAALFGFGTGLTPADVFTRWNAPVWDIFFAVPYTLFWGVVVVWAMALFVLSRGRLRRFLWTLAVVHGLAFVLWILIPTAPPWYVRAYGCEIDITASPNAAALSRLDVMFGITYFEQFYSRAPTVFGAFPSLHLSFPAVAMFTGWQWFGRTGRVVTAALTVWMLGASAYLDHHWLVDGLVTIAMAALVHMAFMRLWPAYARPDPRARWREGAA